MTASYIDMDFIGVVARVASKSQDRRAIPVLVDEDRSW